MISQLLLKNFRIYSNQKVIFPDKGMILIAGPNGSGKSSVGMAIGLVLNLTGFHRYRREKGFEINDLIKEGTDECSIDLFLQNRFGNYPNPFPFDEENIIIQRKLKRYQKGTNIKIKTDSRSFSSYTQFYENARFQPSSTFLYIPQGKLGDLIPTETGSASQISYFDEFINYIALVEDKALREAHENYQKAKLELERFNITHFYPVQEEVKKLAAQFQRYKAFVLRKDSEFNSGLLLHSLLIHRTKKRVEELEAEFSEIKNKLMENKEELQIINRQLLNLNVAFLNKEINQLNEEITQIEENMTRLMLEYKVIETTEKNKKEQIKQLQFDINELSLDLKTNQELLEEAQNRQSEPLEEANKRIIEKINELNSQKLQITTKIENLQDEYEQKRETILEEKDGILKEIRELRNQERLLLQKLGSLKNVQNGNYHEEYPKTVKMLCHYIMKENLDIIGPAIDFVKVKDLKYASVIEIALGTYFLFSFTTTNLKHQRQLDRYIIEKKLENLNVYYYDSEKNNKIEKSYEFNLPTISGIIGQVVDLITIQNPLIQKVLLEYPSRQWLVCETLDTAENVVLKYRKTGIVLQAKNSALIKHPLRYGKGMRTIFHSSRHNFLSKPDVLNEIRDVNNQLDEIQAQISNLNKNLDSLDSKLNTLKKEKKVNIRKLEQEKANLIEHISKLSAILSGTNFDVALIQQKINSLHKTIINARKNLEKEILIFNEIKEKTAKYQQQINEVTTQCEEKKKIREEHYWELSEKENEYNEWKEKKESLQRKVNELEELFQVITSDHESSTQELKQEGEEVENFRKKILQSLDVITKEMNELKGKTEISAWSEIFQAEVQAFKAALAISSDVDRLLAFDIEQIEQDYLLAKASKEILLEDVIVERYDYGRRLYQEQKARKEQLENEKSLRDEEYNYAYEQWYSLVVKELEKLKVKYQELIKETGGTGFLQARHFSKERSEKRPVLSLRASFHEETPPRAITSHLHSGGESTLILLAFILALHSVKPQPVYFLDEPDAHLDPINRDKLFKMIKASCGDSQYFVFSPQDFEERHQIPDAVFYVFKTKNNDVAVKEIT